MRDHYLDPCPETVSRASHAADSIINKISVSGEQMDVIQRQQTRTVHSAALLADSIQDLTQTAASSLNALNETATQIKLELSQPVYHFSGVWWMARRVAEMLFRGKATPIQSSAPNMMLIRNQWILAPLNTSSTIRRFDWPTTLAGLYATSSSLAQYSQRSVGSPPFLPRLATLLS